MLAAFPLDRRGRQAHKDPPDRQAHKDPPDRQARRDPRDRQAHRVHRELGSLLTGMWGTPGLASKLSITLLPESGIQLPVFNHSSTIQPATPTRLLATRRSVLTRLASATRPSALSP